MAIIPRSLFFGAIVFCIASIPIWIWEWDTMTYNKVMMSINSLILGITPFGLRRNMSEIGKLPIFETLEMAIIISIVGWIVFGIVSGLMKWSPWWIPWALCGITFILEATTPPE